MTQRPAVSTTAKGRDGRGSRPVASLWLAGLRWLVVLAFLARAALSLFDARSVAFSAGGALPVVETVQLGVAASMWPLLWGMLAILAAGLLVLRIRIGWLVAVAVTIAYLVAGISDVTALAATPGQDPANLAFWEAFDLCVPLGILACLLAIRGGYLPAARPLPSLHRVVVDHRTSGGGVARGLGGQRNIAGGAARRPRAAVTGSTLDRWRRRN